MITEKSDIRYMAEKIFTVNELKILARNLGINIKGLKKEGLIEKIIEKYPDREKFIHFYEELPREYKMFLHYIAIHGGAMELAEINEHFNYAYDYRSLFSVMKEIFVLKGLLLISEKTSSYTYRMSHLERYSLYIPMDIYSLPCPFPVQGDRMDRAGMSNSFDNFEKHIFLCMIGLRKTTNEREEKILQNIKVFVEQKVEFTFERAIDFTFVSAWYINYNMWYSVFYILKGLKDKEWLNVSSLKKILSDFIRHEHKVDLYSFLSDLCEEGFKYGFLEKLSSEKENYYRCARCEEVKIAEGGVIEKEEGLIVDPEKVPFELLREITIISNFTFENNIFTFTPSRIKLGKIFRNKKEFSFAFMNIYEQHPLYKNSFDYVKNNYGKVMIHSGMSILEIKDITVSALVKHNFPDIFYPLGGNFFAVSGQDEEKINQFLVKKKYSIRIRG